MLQYLVKLLVFGAICQTSWGLDESKLSQDPNVAIPEFFQLCVRNTEGLDECIKDSIQQILPKLANGIPQFAFEPLDPFVSETFKANLNLEGMNVLINGRNIKLHGTSNGRVENVRSDISDKAFNMEVDVSFPKLLSEGSFKATGIFNGLNINSRGPFNISMTDIKTTWQISGSTEMRNGAEYLRVKDFKMDPEVGDMQIYVDGIFPDNEPLTRIANYLANQFWRVVYKEMKPYAMHAWEHVMVDMANKIFLNIPFGRLLPVVDQ